MPIMFNTILREAGLPLADVRLIRHKDKRARKGRTPYELWRDNRPQFELYQSTQSIRNRQKFTAPYWAVFIVNLNDETMFAGLYAVRYQGLLEQDTPRPHMEGIDKAGSCDVYDADIAGQAKRSHWEAIYRLGAGRLVHGYNMLTETISPSLNCGWHLGNPSFPGFLNFIEPLSKLDKIPKSWIVALTVFSRNLFADMPQRQRSSMLARRDGETGFWGRWQDYVQTGHGGNMGLKSRDPSDYQVSILEVAGTSATDRRYTEMEDLWQAKLQSREMGLNRNVAHL